MNLSENIYRLRSQKGMSQGDLALALDVSRQSVSKWETGAATPELDKLMKMSALFGITLDELVNGAQAVPPQPEPAPVQTPPAPPAARSSGQRTWGIALFATGLVAFLGLTFIGGPLIGLLFASPLLAPAIICLSVKKHAGLKCAWAEFVLITTYFSYATGTGWNTLFAYLRNWRIFAEVGMNIFHPILSLAECIVLLILLICTVRTYAKQIPPLTKRGRMLLAGGWCLYLLSFIPYKLPIDIFSAWYRIVGELINWAELALLTVLLVFTYGLIRQSREKN